MPTVGQLPAGIVAPLAASARVDVERSARRDRCVARPSRKEMRSSAVEVDDDGGGARRVAVVAVAAGAGDERDVVAVRPPDDGAHVVGVATWTIAGGLTWS